MPGRSSRLVVDVHVGAQDGTLAGDVRAGLGGERKWLPPKHFYDAVGARLFDAICDTPEYYPTRTEQGILDRVATEVVRSVEPAGARELVELGSGAARKTRTLLEAMLALEPGRPVRYVPVDVSRAMLEKSARVLLDDYPDLVVHGVVGDQDRHLDRVPANGPRLCAFLGSSIGNYGPEASAKFVSSIAALLGPGDRFLLGLDLVKEAEVLHAAYNDAAGLTARFNLNVLVVLNRELDADFDVPSWEHVAFWNPREEQIEMHLRARTAQVVRIRRLEMTVRFAAGETIHTEISRKFTRASAEAMTRAAGLTVERWDTSSDGWFALALLRRR
jgi:L-histidine N-alpha-methyltransferase